MQNKETAKTALARSQTPLYLFIIAIILFFLGIVGLWLHTILQESPNTITVGTRTYTVEVADTQAEREKGLSERDTLGEFKGMLFDFKQEGDWQIWMVKMRFPIDIAWLSKDGKILAVKENVSPDTFPNVFRSEQPSWYVLELNAGDLQKAGVKPGDTIKL